MKATITITSKKYPTAIIPYATIREAKKAFPRVLKATKEFFTKDQIDREIRMESRQGKSYRTTSLKLKYAPHKIN